MDFPLPNGFLENLPSFFSSSDPVMSEVGQNISFKRLSGLTPPYDGSEMSCESDDEFENAKELFSELHDVELYSDEIQAQDELSNHSDDFVEKPQPEKVATRAKRKVAESKIYAPVAKRANIVIKTRPEKSPPTTVPKQHANNHNALMARRNREKKKQFISELQSAVKTTTDENHHLKSKVQSLTEKVDELDKEVRFLRSVLHNQSALSKVLTAVAATPGVKVTGSLGTAKPGISDHDYYVKSQIPEQKPTIDNSGVCLHVSGGNVSFELCHKCNESHNETKPKQSKKKR